MWCSGIAHRLIIQKRSGGEGSRYGCGQKGKRKPRAWVKKLRKNWGKRNEYQRREESKKTHDAIKSTFIVEVSLIIDPFTQYTRELLLSKKAMACIHKYEVCMHT